MITLVSLVTWPMERSQGEQGQGIQRMKASLEGSHKKCVQYAGNGMIVHSTIFQNIPWIHVLDPASPPPTPHPCTFRTCTIILQSSVTHQNQQCSTSSDSSVQLTKGLLKSNTPSFHPSPPKSTVTQSAIRSMGL